MIETLATAEEQFVRANGRLYKRKNAEIIRLELDTDHYYWIDGLGWVPSVTSILDEAAPVPFGLRQFWKNNTAEDSEQIFKTAGGFGTKMHNAVQLLLEGQELDLGKDYPDRREKKAIHDAFPAWFNMVQPTNFMTEEVVGSVKYHYAGTLDFLGTITRERAAQALGLPIMKAKAFIDGQPTKKEVWLIDFKTTSQLSYNHELQVAAYKQAVWEGFGIKVDRMGLMRFPTQHKVGFEFKETFRDIADYMYVYQTYMNLHNNEIPHPTELIAYPKKFRLLKEVKK